MHTSAHDHTNRHRHRTMARGVNKVILIGHLGQDPDFRLLDSGTGVCNMSLATDESYTDRNGNRVDQTEWHRIEAWGRVAENCNEYLQKGAKVYVEGSLKTDEWEDRDGNDRRTTKIKARRVLFLDRAGSATNAAANGSRRAANGVAEPAGDGFVPDDEMPF